MRVAAAVAKSKEQTPDRYCPIHRCLWRVVDREGNYIGPCGKHGDLRKKVA
jgi:hypothetical protein